MGGIGPGQPRYGHHLAPRPAGVPYEEQQYHALMAEHGVLDVTSQRQTELASEIRRCLVQ